MTGVVAVLTTVPSAREGRKIAVALVEERLAACVNVLPGLTSHYRWKGRLESARERLLIIKTTRSKLPALKSRLPEMHPYETPEIIALPVVDGGRAYLGWIADSLKS